MHFALTDVFLCAVDSFSFNGNIKGPSGKMQHQWTAPPPQSKTGGPNWQAMPTSRTSLPQSGVQPGGFVGQPGVQPPAGFRASFGTQPMGQPFMVGKKKTLHHKLGPALFYVTQCQCQMVCRKRSAGSLNQKDLHCILDSYECFVEKCNKDCFESSHVKIIFLIDFGSLPLISRMQNLR